MARVAEGRRAVNERCESGTHKLRWMGDPEHDADTDTWWVMAECRVCGHQECVNVTGTLPIAVHQAHLAWVDVFRSVAEAWRLDRLVAWLARKIDWKDGGR